VGSGAVVTAGFCRGVAATRGVTDAAVVVVGGGAAVVVVVAGGGSGTTGVAK
jgi:hypothetical protein